MLGDSLSRQEGRFSESEDIRRCFAGRGAEGPVQVHCAVSSVFWLLCILCRCGSLYPHMQRGYCFCEGKGRGSTSMPAIKRCQSSINLLQSRSQVTIKRRVDFAPEVAHAQGQLRQTH